MLTSLRRGTRVSSVCFRFQSTRKWTAGDDEEKYMSTHEEGNNLDDNWSLGYDGVVNTNLAFKNAKTSTIVSRLPGKNESGKIHLKDIPFSGQFNVLEAGETLDQKDFTSILDTKRKNLSDDKILFFEDVGLGASSAVRVGARIISDNPAHALIFRSLMINIPPRPSNHLARLNGWASKAPVKEVRQWNGQSFDVVTPSPSQRGERPIIAYIAERDSSVAVQFEQLSSNSSAIAGANIIAGHQTPIRAVVQACGIAGAAMINEESKHSLALPSLVLRKGDQTVVVVGEVSEELINKTFANGSLYGAYFNVLTDVGVTAVFNGCIVSADAQPTSPTSSLDGFRYREAYPNVVSNGSTAVAIYPDNFIAPASVFVFVGTENALTVAEAAAKLTQASGDPSKADLAASLLKDATIKVVGSQQALAAVIG